jgi:flagellar biosynthesis/type III secretory pathway chaperone
MSVNQDEKTLYYHQAISIWEQFCVLHNELFDLTCREYLVLLESNIEMLESMLLIKEDIIRQIGMIETDRSKLIHRLNESGMTTTQITRAADLIDSFHDIEQASGVHALKNLNSLLIEIITKLQEQNKKNQIFLNKAMISVKEMRQGFSGKKQFSTYGADGQTRSIPR